MSEGELTVASRPSSEVRVFSQVKKRWHVFIRKGRQERLQTKTYPSKVKGELPRLTHPSSPPLNFPGQKQYIDPIIAATWSEDGAIHDVCKALSPRFREPNSIVSLLLLSLTVMVG